MSVIRIYSQNVQSLGGKLRDLQVTDEEHIFFTTSPEQKKERTDLIKEINTEKRYTKEEILATLLDLKKRTFIRLSKIEEEINFMEEEENEPEETEENKSNPTKKKKK
jgi:hypothetical protein